MESISEMQNRFLTIELNAFSITVFCKPKLCFYKQKTRIANRQNHSPKSEKAV